MTAQEPPPASLTRSVKRGVAWSTLTFGLSKGLSLLSVAVLARVLVPSQFGLVAAVLVMLSLIELTSDLGMKATVIWEQEKGASDRVQTAFTLNMLVVVILTLITIAASGPVAGFFHASGHVGLFRLAALDVFLTGLGTTHDGLLLRDLRFNRRMVAETVNALVRAAVGVTLALSGLGAASLVWGMLAGTTAWTIAQWSLTSFRPRLRFDRKVAVSMVNYAAGASMLTVIAQLNAQLDVTVVGRVLGQQALGLYTVAFRLPTLLLLSIANQVSLVAFPALAQKRIGDASGVGASTHRLLRYQSLYSLPLATGLAVLAPPIMETVFSAKWRQGSGVLAAVAILSGIAASTFALGDGFKALARQRVMVVLNLVQFPIVVATVIAVARYGITAVAWSQTGVEALFAAMMMVAAQRVLGVTVRSTLAALWPGAVAAMGVLAGAGAVRLWSGLPAIPELIVATVGGIAGASLALALLSRGTWTELRNLTMALRKARSASAVP